MARDPDRRPPEETRSGRAPEERRGWRAGPGAWFTSTLLQAAVVVVGLVALLFALSMAFGVDLLGMLGDALSTQTGQWLAIAVVILVVTGAAVRALSYVRSPP